MLVIVIIIINNFLFCGFNNLSSFVLGVVRAVVSTPSDLKQLSSENEEITKDGIVLCKTQSKPLQGEQQYLTCQPTSVLKAPKKQRIESNAAESDDLDHLNRNREDVQSPAYSDISDDSAPVYDSDNFKEKVPTEKRQPEITTKKPVDILAPQAQITSLAGYGMYPYYPHPHPQAPYMLQQPPTQPIGSPNSSNTKSPTAQSETQTTAQDFSKNKNPPLDLITKTTQSNIKETDKTPPPPMTSSKFLPNYYPYK